MLSTPAASESFATFVELRRAEIEAELERALPCPPLCPRGVAEAMRHGVLGGGKRLRPLLVLAAAETVAVAEHGHGDAAVRDARRLAMPAACAIEFIHSHSLIHDDLPAMDNDCLRRGRPTVHVAFGEALAILAGDGLLAEAFTLLANEPNDCNLPHIAERKLRVMKRVGGALGAGGMLGGQAMDLELTNTATAADSHTLRDMHARKTGSLIRAAAVSGAIMAGGNAAQIAAIDRFAAEVGLAFQIVDDILDIEGNAERVGKTIGKDLADNKVTYPSVFGVRRSRRLAEECAVRARTALRSAGLTTELLAPMAEWTIARAS
jgi:geranylgeranyl diphosphate synthase type II